MDSIELIINDLFSDDFIFKMQASEPFGKTSIKNFKKSDYIFFGGTNALTSNINKEKYIGFSIFNLIHFNRLLLQSPLTLTLELKSPNLLGIK